MHSFKSIAFGALALAQLVVGQAPLAFTNFPTSLTVSVPVNITYSAPDLSVPVHIVLRKGDPNNLQTISDVAVDATGGSYLWSPFLFLEPASDYALQIVQGSNENYTPLFTLNPPTPNSVTVPFNTVATSISESISSVISALNSSLATVNATTTPIVPIGTINGTVVATPSAGTGVPIVGVNSTIISPTLSGSTSGTARSTGAATTSSAPTGPATSTGDAAKLEGRGVIALLGLAGGLFAMI